VSEPGSDAPSSGRRAGGRRRSSELDEKILEATRDLMAKQGYQGLSISAVAAAAGTTRPTVYLRFSTKEDLATQAIAGMHVDEPLRESADLRADLIAEVRHFGASLSRPHGMSFVGTVLAEEQQHPGLLERFRERLLRPRRRHVRAQLERGQRMRALRADLDLDVVTTMLLGSVYAHYLAGSRIPENWADRVVDTIWPALVAAEPGADDRSASSRAPE
jgi:AcrR family transcriptional regulator